MGIPPGSERSQVEVRALRDRLREAFVAAFADASTSAPPDGAAEVLLGHVVEAEDRWPALRIPAVAYARHVAAVVATQPDPRAVLARIHGADLCLACACAAGDERALAVFESIFMSQVESYVSRLDGSAAFADEVRQHLREKLFVAEAGLPKISEYSGRGPLGGWLRVVSVRTARNLQRHARVREGVHDEMDRLGGGKTDPELRFLREHYAREFRDAFHATLDGLDTREKNILRLYFIESMSSAAIAAMYKVSSATIRSWIKQWREAILDQTRTRLAERLRLDKGEVDSVIGMLQSRFDVTVSRLLR